MKKVLFVLLLSIGVITAQELIIQENELGFCAIDGQILTSVQGYTGDGYADTDYGVGKSITWQINVPDSGTYVIRWRYGNGGTVEDRNATLLINGVVAKDTIYFPHTGTWTNWTMSDSLFLDLAAGDNKVRIEAQLPSGLGNYDYMSVLGEGVTGSQCTPSYIISSLNTNIPDGGSLSYGPEQKYYDEGTQITLKAHANPGYFFHSWSGSAASTDSVFTFRINSNVDITANFYPDGTEQDPDAAGYATVQDDNGTPFLLIGGALGETVQATTLAQLKTYLESEDPYTVEFSGHLIAADEIDIKSNKTLIGVGDTNHLQGIELSISNARNVIIRNMIISHVTPQDAIEINGAKNIWIDHCDLHSDRNHGKDYYDGLLDIKNEASFITVSWTKIHDHYKAILMASNDYSYGDSIARITFHHDYFYNLSSRVPAIRFGKAHLFNNYYQNVDDGINPRMGACARVERNYFAGGGDAVFFSNSLEPGAAQLINNHFGSSSVVSGYNCELEIPYEYENLLDQVEDVPEIITAALYTSVKNQSDLPYSYELSAYPNPFNPSSNIVFSLPSASHVSLKVYNILGMEVKPLAEKEFSAGKHKIIWNASSVAAGVYFVKMNAKSYSQIMKLVLLK